MSRVVLQGAGWVLRGLWLALLTTLVIAAIATRLGPSLGHEVFVIAGASMHPNIPLGSVVVATSMPAERVLVGDVVTYRGTNGIIVTHRVVETLVAEGEHLFRTKGDASATPDSYLVPQGALVGVVRAHVPYVGYLMAMLAQPSGLLSLATALVAVYLAITIFDEERPRSKRPQTRGVPPGGLPA